MLEQTPSPIVQLLERHEGLKLKSYRCTKGKITIGIGRNLEDNPLCTDEMRTLSDNGVDLNVDREALDLLNKDNAYMLLEYDLNFITLKLRARLPWFKHLSQVRKDVLTDMALNLGVDGLLGFSDTIGLIEQGEYEKASVEMLDSKWAREDVSEVRSGGLSEMMRTNTYPDWVKV